MNSIIMAFLMVNHDLAIGAPGSTTWERACLGLPSIVIPLAENQHEIAKKLQIYNAGIVVELEELSKPFLDAYHQIISDWSSYHNANLLVCDGLGTYRVLTELDFSYPGKAHEYRLLSACAQDIKTIYGWQSDPSTRRYSLNSDIPTFEKHQKWMKEKLKNVRDYFYITTDPISLEKLGAVRLDRLNDSHYLV